MFIMLQIKCFFFNILAVQYGSQETTSKTSTVFIKESTENIPTPTSSSPITDTECNYFHISLK